MARALWLHWAWVALPISAAAVAAGIWLALVGLRDAKAPAVDLATIEEVSSEPPAVVFVPPTANFDDVKEEFAHTFRFENRLNLPITVRDIKASCACAMVKPTQATYAPGEGGTVGVRIDLKRRPPGAKSYSLTLEYEDGQGAVGQARTQFVVNHKPDLVVAPNPVEMRLSPGDRRTARVVVMDYHTRPIQLGTPVVSSERLDFALVERPSVYLPGWRHIFELTLSAEGLPVGNYREEIVIPTNDVKKPQIRVEVLLALSPRIHVAPAALYLKRSVNGESYTGRLFVWDAQGEEVELEAVEVGQEPFAASVAALPGKKAVTLAAEAGKLPSKGTAGITLKVRKPCVEALPVEVRW